MTARILFLLTLAAFAHAEIPATTPTPTARILFLTLAVFAHAETPLPTTTPTPIAPTPRIVGGSEAAAHAYPFVLSLRSYGYHTCGAGLVAPDWAITAAHCLADNALASRYSLDIHRHDIGVAAAADHSCSETIAAASLHSYPHYAKSTMDGDIALIRLATVPRCANLIPMLLLDAGLASTAGVVHHRASKWLSAGSCRRCR